MLHSLLQQINLQLTALQPPNTGFQVSKMGLLDWMPKDTLYLNGETKQHYFLSWDQNVLILNCESCSQCPRIKIWA